MTAVHHARGRLASPEAPRPRISWTMIGALATCAAAAAGTIATTAANQATLADRVAHIEAELPPGAIQRLDERTVQIQHSLDELVARKGG